MKITVKVKPGSSRNGVEKTQDGDYVVYTTAQPEKGKANTAVTELLAEYFEVAKSRISIVAGHASRVKIIEVI